MALQDSPQPHPTTVEPWVPEDTFGDRLARIRRRMSWNVSEAATACGVSHQSWRNWEAGGLPRDLYETAHGIAEATGCSERWLLMGDHLLPDLMAPDLRLVHDAERDAQPGPGQMELPLGPRLTLVQ